MDAIPSDAVLLRPLTREDVPALARIAAGQGRNVSTADYERFLGLEGARGFALEREGALLGAATALRYYEHAFVGPVVLVADAGADGLGIALLAHLIESLQREGVHVVDAEASPGEEPLLARMGFTLLRETTILERPALAGAPLSAAAASQALTSVPLARRHLLDLGQLDADAVGYGRKDYLVSLAQAFEAGARVLERDGEVVGFALLRKGHRGYHLGPVVTRDADAGAACALALEAAAAAGAEAVTILAPSESPLVADLERHGFARVGRLARMRAAARSAPSESATAHEWALGGRMTG